MASPFSTFGDSRLSPESTIESPASRGSNWRQRATLLLWVAIGVAIVAFGWLLIAQTADRLLRRDAEATATGYARYLTAVTPGLADLFDANRLNPETGAQLQRLRKLGDVFRFKLFDRHGRQILVSDDLDKEHPLAAGHAPSIGQHQGNTKVETIVLGGGNHVELKRGGGATGRPDTFVEAYVPMLQAGRVIGVVEVYVDQTETAARIQTSFLHVGAVVAVMLAALAAAITVQARGRLSERRTAAARFRYLAEHDVLSGALNRASFNEAVTRAAWRHQQGGPAFAVLYVDLDHFKDVNDSHGHSAGDAVIREATERLRAQLRRGDLLARLGGDEFAVLQSATRDAEDVASMGSRIVEQLAEPYDIEGQRVTAGASVGAARFGSDAGTVEDLLHKADVAMYRAKSEGRGRFSFYDAALDTRLSDRRTLARDLRHAMSDRSVDLHFQPLYESGGRRLVGYEALMRWNHPSRGSIPPVEFIPLAEETGLIEALGEWALHRACTEAATWPGVLTVSVNLSAAQFHGEKDLITIVADALAKSGLPPSRLMLEITESLLLKNTDTALRTLKALSAMGVQIAMDDFGTGYSSLSYLWRFPFNKIKIDRAFTQGLGDDKRVALIVRSIITLAHSMGIRVNAEGVETEGQLEHLRRLGCDELQGYLLGRPAPSSGLRHDGAAEQPPSPPSASALSDITTAPMPLSPAERVKSTSD